MSLKTGTYHSAGSMFARSYRVVAQQDNRVCIKIVNGPANPYEGFEHITVSSISVIGDKFLVDATGEEILINSRLQHIIPQGTFHFIINNGRLGIWQHIENDFEPDVAIDECLSSTGKYVKMIQGDFITGHVPGQKKGKLIAKTDSQIDVRTDPGERFESPHYGLAGDEVTLIESARETDSKQIWYKVKFPKSGAEGWIRSDFIQQQLGEEVV